MRKIFTFIIFGFVLTHLTAQPLSNGGFGLLLSGNPQASSPSRTYTQVSAPDANVISRNSSTSGVDYVSDAPFIKLYPNPAGDQIQVTVNDRMIGHTIRIYNLLGSEMISRNIDSGQEAIDVSNLQQGLYLYSIIDKNNKTVLTGKFNKQ